jgi:hypothetical protein
MLNDEGSRRCDVYLQTPSLFKVAHVLAVVSVYRALIGGSDMLCQG